MAYIERQQDCANSQSLSRVKDVILSFLNFFAHCLEVAGERHKLSKLDDRMLKDVGLSRADVHRETSRSFWDVPSDRL